MEYKTIWIEVDDDESNHRLLEYGENGNLSRASWLKRVDIPIYTEQELKDNADKVFEPPPKNYDKYAYRLSIIAWKDGYAACQEELLSKLK